MRIIIIISLCLTNLLSFSQQDKNMLTAAVDANLSFTDASSVPGFGVAVAWQHKAESNFGLGIELTVDRVFGGSSILVPQPAKGYEFNTTVVGLLPTIDYSVYLFRFKKVEVKPSVGVGLIYFAANGTFVNPQQGVSLYQQYGEPVFYPVYENGNVVDAVGKANKVALALLPGFSLAYYITPQFKIFGRVGYLMAQTDDIDAYNLPVAANQGRDIIQVNHLGFGYQLYRKKFY